MKIVVVLLSMIAAVQSPTSTLDAALARMDGYLAGYEPKLSELIADETMLQEMRHTPGRLMAPIEIKKRVVSEVAFVALPGNAGWLGFRHVKAVDNQPVEFANASLSAALKADGFDDARRMLAESAQHNLGLPRTTNLPNLPLEFLHVRNRRRLLPRLDGQETVRATRTTRLVFVERMTPTLIRNPNGDDMPSVIRAWIDPRNGNLLRAQVSTFLDNDRRYLQNEISVEFGENKTLGLIVPLEMRETFPVPQPGRGKSVATYGNFRRFQTSARIIPQ